MLLRRVAILLATLACMAAVSECAAKTKFKYDPGVAIEPINADTRITVNVKKTEGFSDYPNLAGEIQTSVVDDLQKSVFPSLVESEPDLQVHVDVRLLKLRVPFLFGKAQGTAYVVFTISTGDGEKQVVEYSPVQKVDWSESAREVASEWQVSGYGILPRLALREALNDIKSRIQRDRALILEKLREPEEELPSPPPIVSTDLSAPEVTIFLPATKDGVASASTDSCVIVGFAKDESPIVAVVVDNQEASLSKIEGGVKFSGKAAVREEEREVQIRAIDSFGNVGVKRLMIRKTSMETPVQGEPTRITVDVDNVPRISDLEREDGLCVIFGIEDYKYAPRATFANNDAALFYEYANAVFGIPKQNTYIRTNVGATRGEFEKVFAEDGWLAKRVVKGESDIIFYFSGHGAPDLKSKEPYLIPWDIDPNYASTAFPMDRIYKSLSELGARSVTVFLDACFSGQSRGGMLLADARPLLPVEIEAPSSDITVFTASAGNQISSAYLEKKHGLFTYYLLKGLQGHADLNGDKEIRVGELSDYVKDNVSRKAGFMDREQVPQLLSGDRERVLVRMK